MPVIKEKVAVPSTLTGTVFPFLCQLYFHYNANIFFFQRQEEKLGKTGNIGKIQKINKTGNKKICMRENIR